MDENPLAPARGVINGVLLGTAFWLLVIGGILLAADGHEPTPAPAPTPTRTVYAPTQGPERPARPVPTVTVTRTAEPVSRSQSRTAPLRASDEAFLRCVVHRESRGDPKAENPTSSASGLFQFLDGTWRAYARESGIGDQYRRASAAPPSVQWALARWVVKEKGRYPWHYPPRPC